MLLLPEILNLPPKIRPIITEFNSYKYFVIEGGRGSGKSQSVARFLLYLAEIKKIRVFCGRETQARIEESVHALLCDLIASYSLDFKILKNHIRSNVSGSSFGFRGFREQGSVNIKGLEGVDIVWVDEAESLAKRTIEVLKPTLRKDNVKFFFTMNRYMRDDAVMFLVGRPDCLHIKCNYFDNPFITQTLLTEAADLKEKSERDYRHVWLGEPLAQADDFLFNCDKLYASFDIEIPDTLEEHEKKRVIGIDFAAQGNDSCVATILDRKSHLHWEVAERISWQHADSMHSIGKIVHLLGTYKPDCACLDVGGMGHVVYDRLKEMGIKIQRFDGASTDRINSTLYVNARAAGYYLLKDWFDLGYLKLNRKRDSVYLEELEKIKMKYRSDGKKILQAKVDMKKDLGFSPDNADSLMMAVFTAINFLGKDKVNSLVGDKSDKFIIINRSKRAKSYR